MQWGPPSRARKSTFCLERYRYLFIRFCWVLLTNQIRTFGPSLWKGSRCKSPQVTWPSSDHSRCCQRPANLLGSARTAAAFACPCVWTRLCPVPPPDIGHLVADQLRGAEADRWQDEPSRPSPSILSWRGVSHIQLCGCFSFVQLTKKFFFLQDTGTRLRICSNPYPFQAPNLYKKRIRIPDATLYKTTKLKQF